MNVSDSSAPTHGGIGQAEFTCQNLHVHWDTCFSCSVFDDAHVFKIAGLVHQSIAGVAPAYLANDCRLLSDAGRRSLRRTPTT